MNGREKDLKSNNHSESQMSSEYQSDSKWKKRSASILLVTSIMFGSISLLIGIFESIYIIHSWIRGFIFHDPGLYLFQFSFLIAVSFTLLGTISTLLNLKITKQKIKSMYLFILNWFYCPIMISIIKT